MAEKTDNTILTTRTFSQGSGDYPSSLDSEARSHIFQDEKVAEHYRQLYEDSQYEARHHFDPSFEWTPQEEKKLVWKTEWRVTLWAFIMFVALDIDRYNINNATAGTFLQDLNLTTNDFNLGKTVNLVCFLAAELPSQLISKKIGPDRWIPIQLVLWSLVGAFQSFIQNKAGFLVTRGLIGALQGGFIPDVCLWMSYFYTGKELGPRLGYFYIANPLTQAISSLLAYGIFHLHGHANWAGWRWVFMIEGVATLVIGLASFFMMPPSAVQTKSRWRPNGWFNEREEKIMVNRVLRDDPSKGDMHNRQALSLKLIFKSVLDYDIWPVYIVRLFTDMVAQPIGNYQAIILRTQGFSTLKTNLLMIPPQILVIITMLTQVHLSHYFGKYGLPLMVSSLWVMPSLAAMKWWPGFLDSKHPWASYILIFFAIGGPPSWPVSIAWCSANANSVRTRTVSAAVVNIFSQTASITAANIFRKDDAPRYQRGVGQLFALSLAATASALLAIAYYSWRNKSRSKKWNSWSIEQKAEYLDSKTEGSKRIDFKFKT